MAASWLTWIFELIAWLCTCGSRSQRQAVGAHSAAEAATKPLTRAQRKTRRRKERKAERKAQSAISQPKTIAVAVASTPSISNATTLIRAVSTDGSAAIVKLPGTTKVRSDPVRINKLYTIASFHASEAATTTRRTAEASKRPTEAVKRSAEAFKRPAEATVRPALKTPAVMVDQASGSIEKCTAVFDLLRLPRELRDAIYELVIAEMDRNRHGGQLPTYVITKSSSIPLFTSLPHRPALLLINRQVNHECRDAIRRADLPCRMSVSLATVSMLDFWSLDSCNSLNAVFQRRIRRLTITGRLLGIGSPFPIFPEKVLGVLREGLAACGSLQELVIDFRSCVPGGLLYYRKTWAIEELPLLDSLVRTVQQAPNITTYAVLVHRDAEFARRKKGESWSDDSCTRYKRWWGEGMTLDWWNWMVAMDAV